MSDCLKHSCSLSLEGRMKFRSLFISWSSGLLPPAATNSSILFSNLAMPTTTCSRSLIMYLPRVMRTSLRRVSRRMFRPWSRNRLILRHASTPISVPAFSNIVWASPLTQFERKPQMAPFSANEWSTSLPSRS